MLGFELTRLSFRFKVRIDKSKFMLPFSSYPILIPSPASDYMFFQDL